jgi:hypothetical protein
MVIVIKTEQNRIPKERPKETKTGKCCKLGLNEPAHGRYWNVLVNVHAP